MRAGPSRAQLATMAPKKKNTTAEGEAPEIQPTAGRVAKRAKATLQEAEGAKETSAEGEAPEIRPAAKQVAKRLRAKVKPKEAKDTEERAKAAPQAKEKGHNVVDMLRKAAQLEKPSSSSAAEKPASSSAAEAENPTDIAEAEAIPGIAQLTDRKVASESKSQVVLRLVGKSLSQRLRDIASVLHVQVSGGGR